MEIKMSRPLETDMLKAHIFNFELFDNSENPLTGKGLCYKYLDCKNITPEKPQEEFNPVFTSSCSSIHFTQDPRQTISLVKGLSSNLQLGAAFKNRSRAMIKINIYSSAKAFVPSSETTQFNGRSFFFMYNSAEWLPFITLDAKANNIAEEKIVLRDCEFLGIQDF